MGRARFAGLLLFVLTAAPEVVAAQATAALPLFVIRDAQNEVVGPVIAVEQGIPVLLFDDTAGGGRKVHLRIISPQGFNSEEISVFYSESGCEGNVYLTPPAGRAGLRSLTGIGYGVGPGTGGEMFLYRSTAATGTSVNYVSIWVGSEPNFSDPSSACQNIGDTMAELVAATPVLNITNDLPPPYTVD